MALAITIVGCDKIVRPPLGDYPKDNNSAGGTLKFYAAMNANNVDSIKANYGVDNNVTYVTGVSGKAAQFTNNGYITYPSANDFGTSTSFTISFWMNITLAQKDNGHAVGVLAVASSSGFWGNATFYADNNDKGPSDSMNLKVHFANGSGDNWNFAGYTGTKRWPHMYDGQWHLVTFTYDAPSSTGIFYRDGAVFDKQTGQTIVFDGKVAQVVVGGFQEAAGIVDSYSNNTWMAGFPGSIDNLRLYSTALSASDVASLYANKQ